MKADIVVGLSYGDEGKGKITHHLCKERDYTHVIRYNGGCNAGHTIYHNGKKIISHHLPCGVMFGIKSIIGPGCVLSVEQFFKEIQEFKNAGINTDGLIFISKNTHIITQKHLEEDGNDTSIGTTKRGNGPAYRDKFGRTGLHAKDVPELAPYLIDIYEELHERTLNPEILFEGAQGFGLDIDWGDYPYVTSSNCISSAALANGVPPQAVRDVWGVAKAYDTYVGAKNFQPNGQVFNRIQEVGQEFGATTGRKRQVDWLDIEQLKKAIKINGATHVVFNKCDILEEVGSYAIKTKFGVRYYNSFVDMKEAIEMQLDNSLQAPAKIHFSYSPKEL